MRYKTVITKRQGRNHSAGAGSVVRIPKKIILLSSYNFPSPMPLDKTAINSYKNEKQKYCNQNSNDQALRH